MNSRDLESRLQQFLDGQLSPEEEREMIAVLEADPAALRIYYEYARLESSLERLMVGALVSPEAESIASIALSRDRKRSLRTTALSAAALFTLLGVSLWLILAPEPRPVLTFRAASDAAWSLTPAKESETPPPPGTIEEGSRLILREGSIELTFSSGIRSIVRSPADLTLLAENHLSLRHGSAWFRVEENGLKFRVTTPELDIVDLGTEFAVLSADEVADEVHLFEGRVEVNALKGLRKNHDLLAGAALMVDPAGRLKDIPLKTGTFHRTLPDFTGTIDLKPDDRLRGLRSSTSPSLDRQRHNEDVDGQWGLATDVDCALATANREVWVSRQDLGEDPPPLITTIEGLRPGQSYEISLRHPVHRTHPNGDILAGFDGQDLNSFARKNGVPAEETAVEQFGYLEVRNVIGTTQADDQGRIRVRFAHVNTNNSRSYLSAIGVRIPPE